MADEGDEPQQPPRAEPPEYKVYRSRPRLLDRSASPTSPARAPLRGAGTTRTTEPKPLKMPGERARAGASGLKWVGIAALGWILISFLAFAISAQLQTFKLSGGATRRSTATRSCSAAADDPRARHRRRSGASPGPDEAESQECFDAVSSGNAPPRRLLAGRIPRRHADADPRRRRHLPQTLDPPRHARRDPRPRPAEDQRRLRLRRRQARRSGRSRTSSGSTSTTSRSSTSPASKTSSTRSAGIDVDLPDATSARASRRRRASPCSSTRARTPSTATRRSRSPAPARTPAATAADFDRHRPRARPASS